MSKTNKMLIVDDELSMREFLEVLLAKEGYKVSIAKNGKQAIGLIRKNGFDLILSDIRLGDITGLEVLKEAKKNNPETVVIMISAYSTTEIAVEAMNAGADALAFADTLHFGKNTPNDLHVIANSQEIKTRLAKQ